MQPLAGMNYDAAVAAQTFRQRLGERFIIARMRKGWTSPSRAATATKMEYRTITSIETGGGDPAISSYERYAQHLGYQLADFMMAAVHPESEDAFGHPGVQRLIRVWKGADEPLRDVLLDTADHVDQLQPAREASEGAQEDTPASAQATDSSHLEARRRVMDGDKQTKQTSRDKRP